MKRADEAMYRPDIGPMTTSYRADQTMFRTYIGCVI